MGTLGSYLRTAREARSMGVHWLKVEPIWDPLRSDPRYTNLLQRVVLKPYNAPRRDARP